MHDDAANAQGLTRCGRRASARSSPVLARCARGEEGDDGRHERARGEVLIKDLVLGATLSSAPDREAYLKAQAEAQFAVAEQDMITAVRKVLARA